MPAYPAIKAPPRSQPKPEPRVKKHDIPPTLPIGMPFMQPSVNVPEPATLIGDKTGTPYIRMGDNPNGPETLQVTPPAGSVKAKQGASLPVSMAVGGFATVGGSPGGSRYNPTQDRLSNNRWRRRQYANIFAARKNVPDLAAVGTANTIRNSESYKYGLTGVAQPATINTPRGFKGDLPPTVQANYRTQADMLSEEFNEENTLRSLDMEARGLRNSLQSQQRSAAIPAPDRGVSAMATAGPTLGMNNTAADTEMQRLISLGMTPEQAAAKLGLTPKEPPPPPPGMVYYQNPQGGEPELVSEFQAAILKKRDAFLIDEAFEEQYPDFVKAEEPTAPPGQVFYDNPFTPQQENELLTPAESALRRARDEQLLDEQFAKQYPGAPPTVLSKVPLGDLAQAVSDEASPITYEAAIEELVARGYSYEGAAIVLNNAIADAEDVNPFAIGESGEAAE